MPLGRPCFRCVRVEKGRFFRRRSHTNCPSPNKEKGNEKETLPKISLEFFFNFAAVIRKGKEKESFRISREATKKGEKKAKFAQQTTTFLFFSLFASSPLINEATVISGDKQLTYDEENVYGLNAVLM